MKRFIIPSRNSRSLKKVSKYSPGLILTVDEGRCEEEPGEKEESTAEEELRE